MVPYTSDNAELQREAKKLVHLRKSIRASFGVQAESPVILFVGKFQAKKQPARLLDAFLQVRRLHPCTLMLVGAGELESELRQMVAARSIPDVIFAGFLNRSEIGRAYVAADLFVLPSAVNETWGMVVNEAMNYGLPVIVSDKVGCAPDLVANGNNGFVFDHRSAQELADSLAILVSDPGMRHRFGRRSLEIITQWSPQIAANGVVEAATAAVKEHPSHSRD
jgi:glycosyltransferase involved in cell wall biosynthesis